MKYTNKELLKVIDHINSNSKVKPIIILQSDHGWCQESVAPATAQYFEQRFPILNTWQVPDSVKKQLTSDICSVNTFRVLFSALYGENLPLIENTQYYVDESTLTKVPAEFQDLNWVIIKESEALSKLALCLHLFMQEPIILSVIGV